MNLYQLLSQLKPFASTDIALPSYLYGCFRRKSITFFNGLTDETTIVYWFQSASFTIDLRLSDPLNTPILDRQGWIGSTIWDNETQTLSWDINHSYQLHNQWPEPAKLLPIGNAILEFAPSGAYVEDWRQQAAEGLWCGLRIYQAQAINTGIKIPLDGGYIIAGDCVAYAQSRLPTNQAILDKFSTLQATSNNDEITESIFTSYEVSVALKKGKIRYATQSDLVNQQLNLEGFDFDSDGSLFQYKYISGELYKLFFKLDVYYPHFSFITQSPTTNFGINWFNQEQTHLTKHTKVVK
jgi:hypothetical protein